MEVMRTPRPRLAKTATYRALCEWIILKRLEAPVIVIVKAVHTVVFLCLLACVILITVSGIRGRMSHAAKVSALAVSCEAAVFLANGQQCPLTVLVEDLGSDHGQVTDIFLPDMIAKNIFSISTTMLGVSAVAWVVRQRPGLIAARSWRCSR